MNTTVSLKQLINQKLTSVKENATEKLFTLVDNAIRDTLNAIQGSDQLWVTVNTPTVPLNLRRESYIHVNDTMYNINTQICENMLGIDIWVDACDKSDILSIKDDLIEFIKIKVSTFDIPTTISFIGRDDNKIPVTIIKYEHSPKTN